MKLAYVCTDPGVPVFGNKGGSIHVQSVLRALIARGVQIVLFARRLGGEAPAGLESVEVRQLSKAPSGQTPEREQFLLDANSELREMLSAEPGIDLVYERHSLFSYAAMEFAKETGIPGLLEVNAPLVEEQQNYRSLTMVEQAQAAAARAFEAAGAVLAVSSLLAEWLEQQPEAAGRVHVVPNGVDVSRFQANKPSLPARKDQVTIGFVGSLRPWHGVEQLVEAFLQLRQELVPVRLLVVGDGPMREQIEALCVREHAAAIFTGTVSPTQVPGLLASMDIAVAPYPPMDRCYFSPLKLFEYMAAGVAIAASASGQVCEVLDDGQTGLLYEPDDADGLYRVLQQLTSDTPLQRQLGTRAREAAVLRHGWDSVAGRILDLANEYGEVSA
jgi:glycosyltransferase involved in cell wall biosynthesis